MSKKPITRYVLALQSLEKELPQILPEEEATLAKKRLEEITQDTPLDQPELPVIRAMFILHDYPPAAKWYVTHLSVRAGGLFPFSLDDIPKPWDFFRTLYEEPSGKDTAIPDYSLYVCPKDPIHEHDYKRSPNQVMTCPNHKCALVPVESLAVEK